MKISVVQLDSSGEIKENIQNISDIVDEVVREDGPDLVVLPEVASCRSSRAEVMRASAEPIDGPYHEFLSSLAARHRINLHSGSALELSGDEMFNTSVVFGRSGEVLAKYRKMHRFDVTLPNGVSHLESSILGGGTEVVTADVDGVTVGLTICYDLRFPALFERLREEGAEIIVVPSAFQLVTGVDHWEMLLRARAIETQCYVVGPDQIGAFDGGAGVSFAHSMIIDPWGLVVAQVSNQQGYATARFDRDYLEDVRRRMPVREQQVLGR